MAGLIIRHEAQVSAGVAKLEYAIHKGVGYIPRQLVNEDLNKRFHAINAPASQVIDVRLEDQCPAVVDFDTPGLISSAHFRRDIAAGGPLGENWIEIKTAAIGLTEKDIAAEDGLTDISRTVLKCGSSVTTFKPGDRVFALARSRLSTHVRVLASMTRPMDLSDSFTEMATLPSAFCSALYALNHVARIRKGDRVFVQSPASSLGLAVIQIAANAGAEVFASVHTDQEKLFIEGHSLISKENLVILRPTDQVDDTLESVKAATEGKGFNVVLSNSATGLMQSIGDCIASRGILIHVGKPDARTALA